MRILIIDTCLGYLSVALAGTKIIKEIKISDLNQQSKLLASTVSSLLTDHGYQTSDIDTILITKGPGSFTGIRIGLSFALGVQEITRCEFYACTTLTSLKADYSGDTLATITAGHESYFTQSFTNHMATSDIIIMSREEVSKLTGIKIIGHYKEPGLRPDPSMMLKLFKDQSSKAFTKDIEPLYVKAPYF